jgi:predicted alternative tryptophan synthase beta-subunit
MVAARLSFKDAYTGTTTLNEVSTATGAPELRYKTLGNADVSDSSFAAGTANHELCRRVSLVLSHGCVDGRNFLSDAAEVRLISAFERM